MDQPTLIVELQRDPRAPHEQYAFVQSPVHIGRGARNELRLDHAFVSHAHGVLHFGATGVDFVDLGSTNGSFLDGTRLESHRFAHVHAGSALVIGTSHLRVRLDLPEARRAPVVAAGAPYGEATQSTVNDEHAYTAMLAALAHWFIALARNQRGWRAGLGLAPLASHGVHAFDEPAALLAYVLTPGQQAARLSELNAACEQLLCNERVLAHALGIAAWDLSTRSRAR
ncbi:MAG TPA: FHA domain-containing protein [Polyangiales bacterium]